MRRWAHEQGFDDEAIDAVTDEFATYWRGDGGTKLNWEQTWRNAIVKERNWRKKKRGGQATKPPSGKAQRRFDQIDYGSGVDKDGRF